jgi:hypothetical protein
MGPFTIIRVIKADDGFPAAYQLKLPPAWKCHDVFSIDKLKPFKASERWETREIPPPPPEVQVEGADEYLVDKIVSHRDVKRPKKGRQLLVREYLVRYAGYGEEFDEWLPEKILNIGGDLEQLLVYKHQHHLRQVQPWNGLDGALKLQRYEEEDKVTHYVDPHGQLCRLQPSQRQLKFLVLFCGTGSVEKAIGDKYKNALIVSLDNQPKWEPTHCCDIQDWVQRGEGSMYDYPPGYFDFIWASPPCTEYSRAKTVGVRDLRAADLRVNATLEALRYLQPRYYVIENPQGLLHTRSVMEQFVGGDWLPDMKQEVTYCRYGTSFKKPTHLWTNIMLSRPLLNCTVKDPCPHRATWGFHSQTAQSGPTKSGIPGSGSAAAVYPIPAKLVAQLLNDIRDTVPFTTELLMQILSLVPWG